MSTQAGSTDTAGSRGRWSRRQVLQGVVTAGAVSALGALLAACGGASATPTQSAAPTAASAPGGAGAAQATAARPTAVPAAGTPKRGGTLRAAQTNENATLDPLTSGFVSEREAFYNMYDSLVAIDTNLKIIPSLAESWETPDPQTYIFHLRKDVKFHDGTDFNADAVKFNLDRYLTDKLSRRAGEISFIKTTEAVDPSTVKVSLKGAFAPSSPTSSIARA